ncbi:MAG: divalent metal cation transporter [Gemmatimonadetes bacterium]|nr:divalent metal cation transporter [Gemmatimonadota bacterium]
MATSAIGPGFLTQTAAFTEQLGASFAFAILLSVLFDLGAQLNIWRVLIVSGSRAQDVANLVVPGLGHLLAGLVVLGGLAFNVGNVAGAGLGLNVMFGLDVRTGAVLSAALAVALFLVKEAGRAMDRFTVALGFVMVALAAYVAIASAPPLGDALRQSVVPERINPLSIVTIVGGTVGGYITFAGAHRLLDAGLSGPGAVRAATNSATSAILIASFMRVVLFLGALGVVAHGLKLDPQNPPASVFRLAVGEAGYKVFGIVMWSAAITSVVGSAYTSVSFLRGLLPRVEERWSWLVIGFIVVSTAVFVTVGRPVKVLILVGALNGLILPLSLGTMLVAAQRRAVVGDYRHPMALTVGGAIVTIAMTWLSVQTLIREVPALMR